MTFISLKKKMLRDDLIMSSVGGYGKDKNQFLLKHCERTGGHGHILQQCKFQLVIRKLFFTTKVIKHWNRLCRKVAKLDDILYLW